MRKTIILFLCLLCITEGVIIAQTEVTYDLQAEGAAGTDGYMPYYLVSNRHGMVSSKNNSGFITAGVKAVHQTGNWKFEGRLKLEGAANTYSNFYVQEAYAQADWKFLSLMAGSKETTNLQRDFLLSSGSLVWSGNSRPIPQAHFGFNRFVSIPFTKDWVQVNMDGCYGHVMDKNYMQDEYEKHKAQKPNASGHLTKDYWFHHKRFYLRSNPYKHFVATAGIEHAAQFGGRRMMFSKGKVTWDGENARFKDFLNVLIPGKGDGTSSAGDAVFFYGNSVGEINLLLEYQWGKDMQYKIGAYVENPFEDGSGMRKGNGWDGLWGLEYHDKNPDAIVTGAVIEYLQTTHQSGPVHWSPHNDFAGTPVEKFLPNGVSGTDNYYNNYYYSGYCHYGMSIGTSMLPSPAFNSDHYQGYIHTRIKAIHLGLNGNICKWDMNKPYVLGYRVLGSYRKSWGTYQNPVPEEMTSTDGLIELNWSHGPWQAGLSYAFDKGDLYGNNHAACIRVCFNGTIFKK